MKIISSMFKFFIVFQESSGEFSEDSDLDEEVKFRMLENLQITRIFQSLAFSYIKHV